MINLLFKFKTFFCFLLPISSTVSATQLSCSKFKQKTIPHCFSQPLLEAKIGYFFFSDSKMRKIYDKDGLDIQLSGSYPLWNLPSKWTLNAYSAVEYFHRSGKSMNAGQKTSIWAIPVNIGLKTSYAINLDMQYYFSIGPRYFHIHQHNHSSYIYKNKSKNGVGFFVNTGFNYTLYNHFVIDAFGEYSYAKTHFHSGKSHIYTRSIQAGGFTFGGGLGYKF